MLQKLVNQAYNDARVIPDIEVELKLIMANPSRSTSNLSYLISFRWNWFKINYMK